MKNKENRGLSYKNILFVSSFAGLMGFMAVPSWTKHRDEDRVLNAKRQAEVLGYQVFEIYREAARNTRQEALNLRAPASVEPVEAEALKFRDAGSIGADPWGQPYRYKILSSVGEQIKVQIWSAGPNKIFETDDKPGVAAESYTGDDVGVVLTVNHRPGE
jgi:type II secretory pathway pseudopilin PulG